MYTWSKSNNDYDEIQFSKYEWYRGILVVSSAFCLDPIIGAYYIVSFPFKLDFVLCLWVPEFVFILTQTLIAIS